MAHDGLDGRWPMGALALQPCSGSETRRISAPPRRSSRSAVERIPLRPIGVIVLCIIGSGRLTERAGVAITAAALVLLASYARPGARLAESLALAAAMVVFVIAVFVYALGQPLPVLWS